MENEWPRDWLGGRWQVLVADATSKSCMPTGGQTRSTTPPHTRSSYLESSILQAKKVTHSLASFKDGGDGGFFE